MCFIFQRLVDGARDKKFEEFICEKTILNEIFDNYRNLTIIQSKNIEEIICSDSGKKFISDIHANFHFEDYGKIVRKIMLDMEWKALLKRKHI